jgi:protein O-GlcNAc transferase
MSYEPPQGAPLAAAHPLLLQAVALQRDGRLDEAAQIYNQVLADHPEDFDATHLLGVIALQQQRYDVAQRLIGAAVALNPHDASAIGNLGTSYLGAAMPEQAFQWFEVALRLQPESSKALTDAATALHNLGRYPEAISLLRKAHSHDPNSYAVCNLLGACLIKNGEAREAAELFETATGLQPDSAEAWTNRSTALNAIGQHALARGCADKAVGLRPHSSTAFAALAAAQFDQGKLTEAVDSYRRAASLPDPSAQTLASYGNALLASGLNEEAIEQLQRAATLDAKNLAVRWAIAIAQIKPICSSEADVKKSRKAFEDSLHELESWYRSSREVSEPFSSVGAVQPFYLAYQPFNNRELLSRYGALCAMWMATLPTAGDSRRRTSTADPPSSGRKLRLGVASAHIHEHSVWNAITRGWVKHLDRSKFEIYLFQLSHTTDPETENARLTVDHLEDRPSHISAWVQAIRERDLDILIYPEIGMDAFTLQLASLRLAPVQAATWGHPETTGLPTMDLFISAEALEPPQAENNYSEKLVRLPNLGVHVEPLTPAILKLSLRSLKLPGNEPLLLCTGAPFKYSPLFDNVWVQISQRLQRKFLQPSSGGRLVFFRSRCEPMDRLLESRLRAAFERASVDFDAHVSIIPTLDRARFFGLMRQSALMLDTLGFSGFNTALQAIECDLPILAFEGEFMRGRLASAIVRRLDLPELVAETKEDFVDKAVTLAGDAAARKKIRGEIIARRAVLFQDMAPVRALEHRLTEEVMRVHSESLG